VHLDQQVIDKPDQLRQLALHHGPHILDSLVRPCQSNDLQAVPDRSKRIAQLMRQCGKKLVFATVRVPQFGLGVFVVRHVDTRADVSVEFTARIVPWDTIVDQPAELASDRL
jgi:hypothetical protein